MFNKSKFRVKLQLEDIKSESILLDIPFIPRKGDFIDVQSIINENNYTDDELDKIGILIYHVAYVTWTKDKHGYLVEIMCDGE